MTHANNERGIRSFVFNKLFLRVLFRYHSTEFDLDDTES